jgi:hypothetical protein
VVALRRRTGQPVVSSVLVPIVGACVVVGTAAALALRAFAPAAPTRLEDLMTCLAVAIPMGVVLVALARASGLRGRLTVRAAPVEAIA